MCGEAFPAEGTAEAVTKKYLACSETERRPEWQREAWSGCSQGPRGSSGPDHGRPAIGL